MTEEQIRDAYGIGSLPDLEGAVAGDGLGTGELSFDRAQYADFEEVAYRIGKLHRLAKGRRPSCKSLSVHGKVVRDSMEKYLAKDAESSSALKEVLKSPRHYLIYRNEHLEPKDTSHFTLGTFIHSAFLEPKKFDKVKVLPEGGRKNSIQGLQTLIRYYLELLDSKAAEDVEAVLKTMKLDDLKTMLSDLESEAAERGYTFIAPQDMQIVNVIRSSYFSYAGGVIPKLIANGVTETSMYGRDGSTGLRVKIRPDCMLFEEQVGANIILSVKTTSAGNIDAFMRDAAKYRYELAEGMYLKVASDITGRRFSGTLMLVAQTVIPFQCALVWLDAEDLEIGKYKYQQAIDVVAECKRTRRWPGFESYAEDGTGIIQARFPSWIRAELKPQYIEQ